jgi:hypothetical protein
MSELVISKAGEDYLEFLNNYLVHNINRFYSDKLSAASFVNFLLVVPGRYFEYMDTEFAQEIRDTFESAMSDEFIEVELREVSIGDDFTVSCRLYVTPKFLSDFKLECFVDHLEAESDYSDFVAEFSEISDDTWLDEKNKLEISLRNP